MCYYTLVTISTVGYGDFAPVSVFGRLFAVVIIAGGVAMFSILLNEITESNHKEASGAGEYSKVVHQKKHIVVLGGAVNQFNKEVVGGFVKQICSCGAMESDIPDIVLFGTHPREGDTLPVLGEMQCKRRVTYLHGSFDNEKDWGRARLSEAIGVYILPEVEVTDTKMEDEVNIICTKTMLAGVGKGTYVRLLLHRPESLVVAAKIGIPEGMCQVWTDISQMILAESINVKGFSTLLTNMMTLNTPGLSTVSSISDLAASAGDWVKVRPRLVSREMLPAAPFPRSALNSAQHACSVAGVPRGRSAVRLHRDAAAAVRRGGLCIVKTVAVQEPRCGAHGCRGRQHADASHQRRQAVQGRRGLHSRESSGSYAARAM
jgi:hypothetical protein